jgi:WD40 repeat protein
MLQENDNTVRIWDVVNKQERAVLQGHDAAVSSGLGFGV